jgi:hypothetical protein
VCQSDEMEEMTIKEDLPKRGSKAKQKHYQSQECRLDTCRSHWNDTFQGGENKIEFVRYIKPFI